MVCTTAALGQRSTNYTLPATAPHPFLPFPFPINNSATEPGSTCTAAEQQPSVDAARGASSPTNISTGPPSGEGVKKTRRAAAKKKGGRTVQQQQDKADRTPLRFFLVREGHKFVPVGRVRRRGAWRELGALPPTHGVPVVLDPSPYQVRVLLLLLLFLLFSIVFVVLLRLMSFGGLCVFCNRVYNSCRVTTKKIAITMPPVAAGRKKSVLLFC